MKIKLLYLLIVTMLIMTACNHTQKINYPQTAKCDSVRSYFGVEVAEPYLWLENDTSAQTESWVNEQNVVTQNYLKQIPFRNGLKDRIEELTNYPKYGSPFVRKGVYYFFKNDGLQNQNVLYSQTSLDAEPEVLLDPNTLSEDGTVSLGNISFSKDGKYLAYTISRSGSDWREIFVLNLETKQLTSDHILWAKFGSVSWFGDGFFYSAYDAPEKGKEFSNVNENHKIYYHKIGDDQSNDQLYYSNPNFPKRFYYASVDSDQNFLFISESGASIGNRLFMKDLRKANSPVVEIAGNNDYDYSMVEVIDNTIYFITNYNAPKYRLAKVDFAAPKVENWTDVLPESSNVLNNVNFTNGQIIAIYDKDASLHAYVYSLNGELKHEVALPTLGSVGFSCSKDESDIFYSFSSFTFPSTIYKYDIESNKSEVYKQPEVKFTPDEYNVEQIFYTSKDGTKVPMFLVYKKTMKKDGQNPVLIYGYGGFNITYRPAFSTMRIPFLESGGIYVSANIRGGGEYGEEWHLAGTKMQKQNVFDDFIAAAEYLIAEKYTNPQKLAIIGGSNGGLLVGAVANQRPDLFKVAIPQVGVMDMLNYHNFTIGWNWASDYGTSADSPEMFEYLKNYSPLHNIKDDGTEYPAILITTADHDDRVVPAHSFKYAAQLQASNTGNNPKLIRIDVNAGHGSGKPISKSIEENADVYSFIMYNLGMKVVY
jgi:Serine proteases of the peptidase family S9A